MIKNIYNGISFFLSKIAYRNIIFPSEAIEIFHRRFYYSTKTWMQNKWLGVKCLQNPMDSWIIQEIIYEVDPDFIIETGTCHGGNALFMASVLSMINGCGRVITIDNAEIAKVRGHAILQFVGNSLDPAVVGSIGRTVKGKKVLVVLDSDHHKDHVLAGMKAYGPMVSKGSYMIVQDTNLNGNPVRRHWGPGPNEAVKEFMSKRTDFKVDRSRERLLFTMHPGGYLKRVRKGRS